MSIKTITKHIVRREISRLKRFERRCAGLRNRFSFYRYLEKVLQLYERLRRTSRVKKWCLYLKTEYDASHARQADLMRLLIEATSDADSKTKSRWARAGRYIWKTTKTSVGVVEFLIANGGPAGCADKLAAVKPSGMRRYVRFGTRILPVPLYIHPELYPRNRALHPVS